VSETTGATMRRQPRQGRSEQRLELILDSLAALIDEVGYNNLSIAMIAKRAQMSGPGIYRYFDDLNAIARELAQRNLARYLTNVRAMLEEDKDEWRDALTGSVDVYAEMLRTEPGFRWLRLGDSIDKNLIDAAENNRSVIARHTAELFYTKYAVFHRDDLVGHVEVLVEIIDALVARAFIDDAKGDPFFLDEAKRVVVWYLDEYLERTLPFATPRTPAP
jgi:AcrR family transcriptional regulator